MDQHTEILPLAAVNGIIFNKNKEILLTQRSQRVREPGKWCLPGGHVDLKETWVSSLRREMKEELGITVGRETLVGLYSDPKLTLSKEPFPEGFRAQYCVAVFLINGYTGEVKVNEEVDDWDWFGLDNLPDPMVISHPVRIRDAFAFHKEVFIR